MHAGHCEVSLRKLILEEIDLSAGVAVNDRLRDGQRLIEVCERVHLPLFLLNCNVELANTFKGQFVLLHQDTHSIAHELGGHVQNLRSHGGREKADLHIRRQALEDVIDLILEATRHELIGFIKDEDFEIIYTEVALVDHVEDTAWCSHNKVLSVLELVNVFADGGSANANVSLDLVVVTQCQGDLVDLTCQLTSWSQNQSLCGI
mmetsp:Transcript_15060/g.26366  ORF Transcript_15060/g.26366 Transcript_15060/m.26366 type:complete len:205 (+) Transcript_15060:433-1047(+)